ncbi:MAG: CHAT domain-containing protein, partial [Leptolyngbya sp. SIO3F4]|nr:CHAT domain-containing protein [Leptolyngbya sp. SIO3F4]
GQAATSFTRSLLNPAGIIFGSDVTLSLPANLTAIAGDRILFDEGAFRALGTNNYETLVGSPTAFAFDQPGTIRNEGTLLLSPGQTLTLLGGEVINKGDLIAENIQIKQVSEEQIIQVSQEGSLLNLEFSETTFQETSNNGTVTSTMLPSLLTNGEISQADQIITNSDGEMLLTDSSLSPALVDDPVSSTQNSLLISNSTNNDSPQSFESSYSDNQYEASYSDNQLVDDTISSTQNSQFILPDSTDSETSFDSSQSTPVNDSPQSFESSQSDSQTVDRQTSDNTQTADDPSDPQSPDGSTNETQAKVPPPPRSKFAGHRVRRAALNTANASAALEEVEELRTQEFSDYFGRDLGAKELTLPEIQQLLSQVHNQTGNRSVVVYIKTPKLATGIFEQTSTALELLIFKPTGEPVSLIIPGVSQADLSQTVEQFRRALISSAQVGSKRYLPTAQTLYQWLIKPIENELGSEAIDTILFSMDSGLRTVPIAALHDGQQFLVEKYSVGMIPSLGLMSPHYQPIDNAQVLAMGASTFESLQPLPAVPAEIETIGQLWPGRKFLNETFTQQNLISQQQRTPAQIIHLATHAEFNAGNADDSYIQLWDEQLQLSDIHTLGWDKPSVDLLVLSACRTALGDANAEMGFAGLAVAAGVKSALASLWSVSDVGTLALMSEFYHQLMDNPLKSNALRAAQLAMLKGETRLEKKQLPIADSQLPEDLRDNLEYLDVSHPYFWAGFTMIGSPW